MTTLLQLFEFVDAHQNSTLRGLALGSQTPVPNPPPTAPFVTASMCSQAPSAAVSFVANPGSSTITFPQVMMFQESFTWPPHKPPPGGAPGEGQFLAWQSHNIFWFLGLGSRSSVTMEQK